MYTTLEQDVNNELVTHARLLDLLDYNSETGDFVWRVESGGPRRKGRKAGCVQKGRGYRAIGIDQRLYYAHRLAWFYVHGAWPFPEVDHINGNPDDNRIANLRQATRSINCTNIVRKPPKSGIRCVHKAGRQWIASLRVDGEIIRLGPFKTAKAAHAAYAEASDSLRPGYITRPQHELPEGSDMPSPDRRGGWGSSGVRGVHKSFDKWRAVIYINKRQVNLGRFSSKEEAVAAHRAAVEAYSLSGGAL